VIALHVALVSQKKVKFPHGHNDPSFNNYLKPPIFKKSKTRAYETAKENFGGPSARFPGIDSTMHSRPLFDIVIFYGGAYASTGMVTDWQTQFLKIIGHPTYL
jgi:hypothetical protein